MNIRRILLGSPTRAKLSQLSDNLGDNKAAFKEIVEIYCAGPYRITHRAAHVMEGICRRYPGLIRPHLKGLIRQLQTPQASVSLKRNTIRLFQFIEIPPAVRGDVLDLCFDFLQDKREPIAVKVFSMSVIVRIAEDEPDLLRELKVIIEDQLPYSGPAFRSRASKVLETISHTINRSLP